MIHIVRVLFILLVAAVAFAYLFATLSNGPQPVPPPTPVPAATQASVQIETPGTMPVRTRPATAHVARAPLNQRPSEAPFDVLPYSIMVGGVILAFLIITADLLIKKKNLSAISGLLLGLLVGVLVSVGLSYLIETIANIFLPPELHDLYAPLIQGAKLLLGLMCCYLCVSFVLQTKDDFRFIIPYVEFSRATRGPRPMLLDTSVIIDGRIAELAATSVFESPLLVPRFVLNELQTVADSSDRLKRSRGRRGLDVLEKLKAMPKLDLRFWEGTLTNTAEMEGVDHKLVALAQQEDARIVTNDFNLNKVATLRGVTVINLNAIAESLKPVALPGETMKVRVVKPGEGVSQGVGYLEDGTMVVVEGARDKLGAEVEFIVTNALQTNAGKMIFGRTDPAGHAPPPTR